MNYLVLFLLPSVAECTVTLVLFFVRFDSPELAAVALLSFVAYVFITVQITIWRKKFRQGQNKQDNKYVRGRHRARDRQTVCLSGIGPPVGASP